MRNIEHLPRACPAVSRSGNAPVVGASLVGRSRAVGGSNRSGVTLRHVTRIVVAAGVLLAMSTVSLSTATAQAVRFPRATNCPACGHNLILNPGAEAGPGTASDSVVPVPDWKGTGGFTAAQYAWSGGDISATTPGPANRGKNYFYGGPGAAKSTGTQVIEVSTGALLSGKVGFVLSGWLGGFSNQGDDAALTATFLDASGKALSKAQIGPVTEAQRGGNSELLFRQTSGLVPAGTQEVSVELLLQRSSGNDNDGLADNLSLVFSTAPPETSSSTSVPASTTTTTPTGPGESASASIQYTPETVVVPASVVAATLRSVSPDGSTYTFSKAEGPLAKLKAGSVMFLQGLTVRVVTSASEQGRVFVVVTSPAGITDMVQNGTISWDQPVDFADATAIQGPGAPELALWTPGTGRAAVPALGGPHPNIWSGVSFSGSISGASYRANFSRVGNTVAMGISLTKSGPVNLSASLKGYLQDFGSAGSIEVKKGSLFHASIEANSLHGQFTLSYELKATSGLGLGSFGGKLLKLPFEVDVPVIVDGVPFFVGIGVVFYIAVGFSLVGQQIGGTYTVSYDGSSGFSLSGLGSLSALGSIQGLGKAVLDAATAVLNGPITVVLGADIPEIEVGLGWKEGMSIGGFVKVVADTAIKVGGQGPAGAMPETGGCDARDLKVEVTAGARAGFFGIKIPLGVVTLFDHDFLNSYPPACGTV